MLARLLILLCQPQLLQTYRSCCGCPAAAAAACLAARRAAPSAAHTRRCPARQSAWEQAGPQYHTVWQALHICVVRGWRQSASSCNGFQFRLASLLPPAKPVGSLAAPDRRSTSTRPKTRPRPRTSFGFAAAPAKLPRRCNGNATWLPNPCHGYLCREDQECGMYCPPHVRLTHRGLTM